MTNSIQFINFFRQAAPYIHQHRNRTFVFCIQDDEITRGILKSLLHDIAILHSLRVKVVIVFGARYSLNNRLENQGFHNNYRITDATTMRNIQEIIGALQIQIESILSMGLANSPMQGAGVCTSLGNFIVAKPVGVRDGIDFGFTGEIRKVHSCNIHERLNADNIVIIPPLGYSTTGEVFNLTTEAVASQVASAIRADKLLFFNNEVQSLFDCANSGGAITPSEATEFVSNENISVTLQTVMEMSAQACVDGVKRIHIVPKQTDGAVLAELFTRDGVGLMITNEAYDRIEQATIDDIPSLLQLIRPLEKQGILVRRSRELLEMEIEYFSLLKKDNTVIGCTALYPYIDEGMAELGCLAVNPEYRRNGLADLLLQHLEDKARAQGVRKLFCLTTQTSHWFVERGFIETDLNSLPQSKQEFYNFGRSSKPYTKDLL
ncbi:MAG: amino-acid N-acetyltransferase [Gammaproteobacteria bacterium]|nr:amino-acid N-acetyltransferase [Gammaproteobacteria bacterium]